MNHYNSHILLLLLALFVSCKPSTPSGVLSQDDMVEILYDMHIVQAMAESQPSVQAKASVVALREQVLKKYGITQEEWDKSFTYYCNHAELMHEIYLYLSDKTQQHVIAIGGKVQGVQGEDADTANIWNQEPHFILMPQSPYDRVLFSVTPDSTFHHGNRVSLQYDAQMIFQDGMRDVAVGLTLYYEGDSIHTQTARITGGDHGVLSVSNPDSLKVSKIAGFFSLIHNVTEESAKKENTPAPLRLVSLRNVKLLNN